MALKSDHETANDFVSRRSERVPVGSATQMRSQNWYEIEVRIRDLSQTGFMAECGEAIAIGSNISLDVPGIGPVHAQVRWQIGGRMGGMFLDPISLAKCEWTGIKTDPASLPG
jgi:hypothetical protein